MSQKHLLSLVALTLILQACSDGKDEKNLKRRNKELTQQNNQLAQDKDQILAERSAELAKSQQELDDTKETLNKAKEEKAAAESAKTKLEAELATQSTSTTELSEKLINTEAAIKAKEEELNKLRETAATHDANVQKLNDQLKVAEAQAKALADEHNKLITSRDEAVAANASNKAKLEAELAEKTKTIQDKNAEIDTLKLKIATLPSTPDVLAAEVEALKVKLNAAEADAKAVADERDSLKASLEDTNAVSASTKAELEAQLAAKNIIIQDKDAEITALNAQVAGIGNSTELADAQAEVAKLKEERDALKLAITQAEAATAKAQQDIVAANKKIAALESSQAGILKKSLEDIQGLWLNQYKVTGIADAACYEFVHLGATGSFTQAVACSDGRVQFQKHSFDRFSAQAIPEQEEIDYLGAYGFVVDGAASSSTCQDPAASVLKAGNRLVFEMTTQDDPGAGNFKSRSMIVSKDSAFKGFINAGLVFTSNQLDYAAMAAIAGRADAKNLHKAAAMFVGAVEGKGTGISLGCFDANGKFTAQTSN